MKSLKRSGVVCQTLTQSPVVFTTVSATAAR